MKNMFFLDEGISTALYVWVDLSTMKVITVDSGDRARSFYSVHHTDYVKKKPHLFGLEPEDVIGAVDVRDEILLGKVLDNGFVRGIVNPDDATVGLEGRSVKTIHKALRIVMKHFRFEPSNVTADISKSSTSNHDFLNLSGRKLDFFIRNGTISQSRLVTEASMKIPGSYGDVVVTVDPSLSTVKQMIEIHDFIRGLVYVDGQRSKMVVWPAAKSMHITVATGLGLPDSSDVWCGFMMGNNWEKVQNEAEYSLDNSEFIIGNGVAVLTQPMAIPLLKTSKAFLSMVTEKG